MLDNKVVSSVERVAFWAIFLIVALPELLHFFYRMGVLIVSAWCGVEFMERAINVVQLW
jgi:hypothetical protein